MCYQNKDLNQRDSIWNEAFNLLEQLEQAGYEAYIVGGCVRDMLLGRPIHDIDITTSATPFQVQVVFPHTAPTGLKHGTVTVISEKHTFEVTTFRSEGPYDDARRPNYVHFVKDLLADLARRDFTINAMALSRKGEVIDPFNGRRDIEQKVIRAVGVASERFREDALRILRAVRFAAELGFTVETSTLQAMEREKKALRKLATERITHELNKLLSAGNPESALRLLWTERLLSEIGPLSVSVTPTIPLEGMFSKLVVETSPDLRWILFLRMCGVKSYQARNVLRSLKMPRNTIYELSLIWSEAESWPKAPFTVKERHGKVFTLGLRRVLRIIRLAHCFGRLTSLEKYRLTRQFCHADWELPVEHTSQLALNGNALMRLSGREPGPWIGQVLNTLLDKVVSGDIVNHPEALIKEWRQHGPYAP